MYRQYEDPYKVKKTLEDAERELEEAKDRGDDMDALIDLANEVESLERLNFAWQDDEYDEMNATY